MGTIDLYVKEYTETPGPRYVRQDDFSGEDFYIKKLNPLFKECITENKNLVIHLDGVAGYPSSFLDEAFGELVYDFSMEKVKGIVSIDTEMFRKHKERVLNETFPQWDDRRIKQKPIVNTTNLNVSVSCLNVKTGKIEERKIK